MYATGTMLGDACDGRRVSQVHARLQQLKTGSTFVVDRDQFAVEHRADGADVVRETLDLRIRDRHVVPVATEAAARPCVPRLRARECRPTSSRRPNRRRSEACRSASRASAAARPARGCDSTFRHGASRTSYPAPAWHTTWSFAATAERVSVRDARSAPDQVRARVQEGRRGCSSRVARRRAGRVLGRGQEAPRLRIRLLRSREARRAGRVCSRSARRSCSAPVSGAGESADQA